MISVVIPLYNESLLIKRLIGEVSRQLEKMGEAFEMVCVDDGSTDDTLSGLLQIQQTINEIKVIS